MAKWWCDYSDAPAQKSSICEAGNLGEARGKLKCQDCGISMDACSGPMTKGYDVLKLGDDQGQVMQWEAAFFH